MTRLKLWLASILAALAGLLAVWAHGRRHEAQRRDAADDAAYRETRRRIDNADTGIGASDRERIDRLRAFGERNGPR